MNYHEFRYGSTTPSVPCVPSHHKLLMDADALIKLASGGALPKIGEVWVCLTTPEVERETVEDGKKKMYADAEIIKALIKKGTIKIKKPSPLCSNR